MIQVQLKLRPCKSQIQELERWLYHLESVWNWGVRKIELNAETEKVCCGLSEEANTGEVNRE